MKQANTIIVGGPVAVGKSTLVRNLKLPAVQELDETDKLQGALLQGMMEGDGISAYLFQFDMLLNRMRIYKERAETGLLHVFDRSILEDKLFAFNRFGDEEAIWNYYSKIWEEEVANMLEIGFPKIYIVLTCSWEVFKERVYKRDRKSEIDNFHKNKDIFKYQINNYKKFMEQIFTEYEIPHVFIDTDELNQEQVLKQAKEILAKKGITHE
ncbi:deoxynucleoside kinase [Mycoplasma todarodis]|uniref:Deoxynucleoside kinase domain-containing protein n=1 Tax=Mycoplasma todarodis TaxID=1937191 RepID=A0A4R0XTF4_9MOLU|nr:deoxynucleoside kinase [Mycoplasma todarodis]TCG11037.1 hypothetical protein C4B25_02480 [Mycoplasma todarodis]